MSDPLNSVQDPAAHAALTQLKARCEALEDLCECLILGFAGSNGNQEKMVKLLKAYGDKLQLHEEQLVTLSKVATEAATQGQPLQ